MSSSGTILLTGGWGRTASRIAKILLAKDHKVLIASRSGFAAVPQATQSQYPTLIEGVTFDWTDVSTHSAPFDTEKYGSITAIYLVAPVHHSPGDFMNPFIDLAVSKGVKKFVLLSAAGIEKGGWGYGKVHEYLADGGLAVDYCVVRPPWFFENMFGVKSISEEDTIVSATGDGKFMMTSEDDIAEVAAQALLDSKSRKDDVLVIGPELLTFDLIADKLTKILKRPITHNKVSVSEFRELLKIQGIPEAFTGVLASVDAGKAAGGDEKYFNAPGKVIGKYAIDRFFEENKAEFERAAPEKRRNKEDGLLGTRFFGQRWD